MFPETIHLSNAELLRFIDDETSTMETMRARKHLAMCADCQARRKILESTGAELAQLQHSNLHISPGAREQLRAKLDAATAVPWPRGLMLGASGVLWASVAAGVLIAVFAISQHERLSHAANSYLAAQAVPNKHLTPGATRDVHLADICQSGDDDLDPAVSASTQRAVFQEYGMDDARARDYQVDYLINPQLGGTSDIQNLWPEPYGTVWNARVKDALEDRLHQMVCRQQIDLASAQQEIASDWIAAYKKYFNTSYPL